MQSTPYGVLAETANSLQLYHATRLLSLSFVLTTGQRYQVLKPVKNNKTSCYTVLAQVPLRGARSLLLAMNSSVNASVFFFKQQNASEQKALYFVKQHDNMTLHTPPVLSPVKRAVHVRSGYLACKKKVLFGHEGRDNKKKRLGTQLESALAKTITQISE